MVNAVRSAPRLGAVVIGASAGGIEVLSTLLPALPSTTPFAVVVVVHIPAERPSLLAELFASKCALPVHEPLDKQPVTAGIWFAPANYHLLIERGESFALSVDEPVHYSRPSVDVLFESAADAYGARLAALVLTGANSDGAAGARAVRDAGGYVLVQDPVSAEESSMPRAALSAVEPHVVARPDELAHILRDWAEANSR